ncbi:MAG TPA: glycosyltransferase [Candidatus Paceibacterota bacterium]|nr:glycosyltransferase [Candidatus Paceibacterota bacterium]
MTPPVRRKVMFVITKSNWGGAQRYVFDLATSLPRDHFDVSVAFGQGGLLAKKLREVGIATFPIQNLQRDVSAFNDGKSFFELFRLFRMEKPDVVHLNSSKAAGIGALAARLSGVPCIVFTAHGWPFWEQRNPVSRMLMYFFSWLTALLSHHIVVVSDYDLKVAQQMPWVPRKCVRIYNGIDLTVPLSSGDVVRHSFPQGVRITGTIGELIKNKNQIALIEQAKNTPDMYVAIVGEGENRLYLQKKIDAYGLATRVKLFGFMPASVVLRGFDVFALPSLKEGLPYVLLEAKAAGLPIVANRVGGVGEILDAKNMDDFSLPRMIEQTSALYR